MVFKAILEYSVAIVFRLGLYSSQLAFLFSWVYYYYVSDIILLHAIRIKINKAIL